ncbi:hypothetical protein [Hyphomicrobium sp.]|jgi:hypothetical protein|uniref:hypothetical protein n=1 Tax=Hyphomicrobium sp. TaxID=82 RepID=UPI0035640934
MSDDRPPTDPSSWPDVARMVLSNRILQILVFIFIGFEIYNTAVIPAVQGTYATMKMKAEADMAKLNYKSQSQDAPAIGSTSDLGADDQAVLSPQGKPPVSREAQLAQLAYIKARIDEIRMTGADKTAATTRRIKAEETLRSEGIEIPEENPPPLPAKQ